jgi:hypothetical protein
MTAAILTALALLAPTQDPGKGTWSPDGVVCRPGATPTCRYVAPGCELVRVMDDQAELSGTRWVLWCRPPRDVD